MSRTEPRLADLIDDRVARDLRETVRMSLALAGVVVTDGQLTEPRTGANTPLGRFG